jgi:hypothetical protein
MVSLARNAAWTVMGVLGWILAASQTLVVADVAMTKRRQAVLDFKTGRPAAHQDPRVLFFSGPSKGVYGVCEFFGIVAGDCGTHQS